jgi:V8-like Glu-specific endopeptidase
MERVRLVCLLNLLFMLAAQVPSVGQNSPSKSVFHLDVIVHEIQGQSSYHSIQGGTGFFIASDGTALTSSHIVYPLVHDHVGYQLLAILGDEFYGATLICASELPYDPARTGSKGVMLSRDVAEIRLTQPHFGFDQLQYGNVPYAHAHRGPLPAFPALPLGADPRVGDAVRVLGFGFLQAAPVPYEWSAAGTVAAMGDAADGTHLFGVSFSRDVEPGDSGAPVLNVRDEVVGMHTWHVVSGHNKGIEIGVSALVPACR